MYEQIYIDIAERALERAGIPKPDRQVLAMESVVEHMLQQAKSRRQMAEYASGPGYQSELAVAADLVRRADDIQKLADHLKETP